MPISPRNAIPPLALASLALIAGLAFSPAALASGPVHTDARPGRRELDAGDIKNLARVLAIGALLGAAYFYGAGGDDADLLETLAATPLTPIDDAGSGYVCVEGPVKARGDLLAPRLRMPVVFYRYVQTEEWEERRRNGPWMARSRLLKEESDRVEYTVGAGERAIVVRPGGATLEGRRLHEEGVPVGSGRESLTVGVEVRRHRYVHRVFGLETETTGTVLGSVSVEPDGSRAIYDRRGGGGPFVCAAGTRAKLIESKREDTQTSGMISAALGVLGVVLLGASAAF